MDVCVCGWVLGVGEGVVRCQGLESKREWRRV